MDRTFNNRFQPIRIYESGSGKPTPPQCAPPTQATDLSVDFTYSYTDANGHNNGNVAQITSSDWTRTQYFTYDSLNRLATAKTAPTNQPAYNGDTVSIQRCWGEQFGYDPWGNLLSISSASSLYTGCTQENLSVSANTKNQIMSNTYDAAGNLYIEQPSSMQFTYDAENHLISAGGQAYLYDGDGKRVEKASGSPLVANKLYWYGTQDSPILETDAAGNELYRYFSFAGLLVAREEGNDWVDHYGLDALGNVRWLYSYNGAWDIIDYYPFGGERVSYSNSAGNNTRLFTGKERDSESGNDNFGARYYASTMGRFLSPDPLLNSGRPSEPQSWNRYAYALNNPLNIVDPTGLYDLVNNCKSEDKKCNKQFNQHAKDLKNGLSDLQKKVDKMKDGPEKQRLQAALTAFGTEGDHNGVNATFGKLAGDAAAETKYQSNDIGQVSATVTFDSRKISSTNEYAVDAAHEGTHIEDTLTEAVNDYIAHGSLPGLSDFSREYRGYQTSIFAASALGMNSFSRNYGGANYTLWNGSWAQVDRNITNFVTKFHDQTGRPDHPETTPHNPWPN